MELGMFATFFPSIRSIDPSHLLASPARTRSCSCSRVLLICLPLARACAFLLDFFSVSAFLHLGSDFNHLFDYNADATHRADRLGFCSLLWDSAGRGQQAKKRSANV